MPLNVRVRTGRPFWLLCCLLAVSCADSTVQFPRNVTVGGRRPAAWPSPQVAQPAAPPRILRVWLSSDQVRAGGSFAGVIVTSTNVASVEVRTASFSINSTHAGSGVFRFNTQFLDLPPLARGRLQQLFVIARNTAGVEQTEQGTVAIR